MNGGRVIRLAMLFLVLGTTEAAALGVVYSAFDPSWNPKIFAAVTFGVFALGMIGVAGALVVRWEMGE